MKATITFELTLEEAEAHLRYLESAIQHYDRQIATWQEARAEIEQELMALKEACPELAAQSDGN